MNEALNWFLHPKTQSGTPTGTSDMQREIDRLRNVTDERVLKAVYESGLHQYAPGVLNTVWKDGIDIDEPSHALMNFVRKLCNS